MAGRRACSKTKRVTDSPPEGRTLAFCRTVTVAFGAPPIRGSQFCLCDVGAFEVQPERMSSRYALSVKQVTRPVLTPGCGLHPFRRFC